MIPQNSRHVCHRTLSLAPRMSMFATLPLPYQLDSRLQTLPPKKHTNFVCSPCLANGPSTFTYKHQEQNLKDNDYPNAAFSKILHQRHDFCNDTSSSSKLLVIFLGILLKTSPDLSPDVFREPCLDGCVWPNQWAWHDWIPPYHLLKSTIQLCLISTLLVVQLSFVLEFLYSKAYMHECMFRICVCTHRCYR